MVQALIPVGRTRGRGGAGLGGDHARRSALRPGRCAPQDRALGPASGLDLSSERRFPLDRARLAVVDGSNGLRAEVREVFGDNPRVAQAGERHELFRQAGPAGVARKLQQVLQTSTFIHEVRCGVSRLLVRHRLILDYERDVPRRCSSFSLVIWTIRRVHHRLQHWPSPPKFSVHGGLGASKMAGQAFGLLLRA